MDPTHRNFSVCLYNTELCICCACIHQMLMQIHGVLDMCVSKYHFKRGRVVAEACFKRPFDNGCKMGLGCLASLLCCIEGQSIYSCPFPESQQPGSPALPQRTLTKGIFCHKRVEEGSQMCVCKCVSERTLNLKC